ncbi:unnamed protein product [Ambrosiozyma monospora]|uniref:Unnamed protein product n=1 Tax=Ambrosiozyma monospora TaxID=43982 RepID=A0ACB5TYY7_AMBMO|nr:unnamed protein product [Ambrosiozyma monospora]
MAQYERRMSVKREAEQRRLARRASAAANGGGGDLSRVSTIGTNGSVLSENSGVVGWNGDGVAAANGNGVDGGGLSKVSTVASVGGEIGLIKVNTGHGLAKVKTTSLTRVKVPVKTSAELVEEKKKNGKSNGKKKKEKSGGLFKKFW